MPSRAFIELGSNIDPERYLPLAILAMRELGRIAHVSGVYETEPFGPVDQPTFLNAAVELETELPPHELRGRLREIEAGLGRNRSGSKYAPRTIDLDLCLYDDLVIDDGMLLLPHPDILGRPYLARSLADIDPKLPHPTREEAMGKIADRLTHRSSFTSRPEVREAMLEALRRTDS